MDSWNLYFVLLCNRFVLPGIGEINAGDTGLSHQKLLAAYNRKCPYVLLTPAGIAKFFPETNPIDTAELKIQTPEKANSEILETKQAVGEVKKKACK